MGLVTLEKVKAALELATAETKFDTVLTDMIADVSEEAMSYMELRFDEITDYTEYFDGGGAILHLKYANVSSLELWADTDNFFESTDLIPTTEYEIYSKRGLLKLKDKARFAAGLNSVKVKYDGGYKVADLPADLRRAILRQITYAFRRRNDPGLSSVTFPDGSVSKYDMGQWLPEVEATLDRYRRIIV